MKSVLTAASAALNDFFFLFSHKGKSAASFEQLGVKERELFTAFNIDTHPATLFK